MKKKRLLTPVLLLAGLFIHSCAKEIEKDKDNSTGTSPRATNQEVKVWLTTEDEKHLLEPQESIRFGKDSGANTATITVGEPKQEIDGFGFALTGASAYLIKKMEPSKRKALLQELFGTGENDIGLSFLRLSIGASDMDIEQFTYDEVLKGETDTALKKFSIEQDEKHLIPVLQEILQINPHIYILASPWTAPTWMKTGFDITNVINYFRKAEDDNSGFIGGLIEQHVDVYANYFVKYINAMKDKGITINAVTLQNEPIISTANNPSMLMTEVYQAKLIRALGPKLQSASLTTKIICYDDSPYENFRDVYDARDMWGFGFLPDTSQLPDEVLKFLGTTKAGAAYIDWIMKDEEASKYVDGTGFHYYGGNIKYLTTLHNTYPQKNIYFTELKNEWWRPLHTFPFEVTRNWSRNVLGWNLASTDSPKDKRFYLSPGGCDACVGAVTVTGNKVGRRGAYYTMAHFSKFVRPGAVCVDSNMPADSIRNVVFKNSDGSMVMVAVNTGSVSQPIKMKWGTASFTYTLPAKALVTFKWAGTR